MFQQHVKTVNRTASFSGTVFYVQIKGSASPHAEGNDPGFEQKIAPGPPSAIAMAIPVIFPVPTRAAILIQNAWILSLGLFFTFRSKGLQVRMLKEMIRVLKEGAAARTDDCDNPHPENSARTAECDRNGDSGNIPGSDTRRFFTFRSKGLQVRMLKEMIRVLKEGAAARTKNSISQKQSQRKKQYD
jgi:uncharacterized protein (UPF0335 family)